MAASLKKMPGDQLGVEIRGDGAARAAKGMPPFKHSPVLQVQGQTGRRGDLSRWNELLGVGQHLTEKFVSLLPMVLNDHDPAAIHKMRVVSRRLELIISLIYTKPRPAYARKLRGRAKRCRRVLGGLGDCDILLKKAEQAMAQAPARDTAAWKAVAQLLQNRRTKILPRSVDKLAAIEFSSPSAKLQRDFKENGATQRVHSNGKFRNLTPQKADKIVDERILRSLARLWRDFDSRVQESRGDTRDRVVHGLRIATKRLRHLVEVMEKLGVAGSAKILVRLRELQRALGEWHDMEVLEHLTSRLLAKKKFVRSNLELAVEVEGLFLRNGEIKKRAEETFRQMTANSGHYGAIKSWVAGKLPS
jgi:CHAD domain-containing protein